MTCSYCRTLNALSSITQSDNRGEAKFNDFGFSSGVQLTSVDINELCFLTSANPAEVKLVMEERAGQKKNKKKRRESGEETQTAAFFVVRFIHMTGGCRSFLLLVFQFGEETQQAEGEHSDTIRKEIHE